MAKLGICACRFFAGPLVHGRVCEGSSRHRAHRVPLQPPDLLLRTGGERVQTVHSILLILILWVCCPAHPLPPPPTATPTWVSVPPTGPERYYISWLRRVHDQLCRCPLLYLQAEVRKLEAVRFLLRESGAEVTLMQTSVPLAVASIPTSSPTPSTWA